MQMGMGYGIFRAVLISTALVAAQGFTGNLGAMAGVATCTKSPSHPLRPRAVESVASSVASSIASSNCDPTGDRVLGIIFDIDGTLADSWSLGYQATLTVLTEYYNRVHGAEEAGGAGTLTPDAYPLTSEEYHFGCCYTTPERLARHVGLEPEDPSFDSVGEELGRRFDEYYVRLVDGETAGFYDGIGELLVKLSRGDLAPRREAADGEGGDDGLAGIRLAALTNACVDYAHAVLKANCPMHSSADAPPPPASEDARDRDVDVSIYRRFSSIHGADSVPRPKPHGDGIRKCCEEMGLLPSQVIYVGDAPTDARAAVDADCRAAIGVLWGSNDEECLRREGGFDALCRDVEELGSVIGGYL